MKHVLALAAALQLCLPPSQATVAGTHKNGATMKHVVALAAALQLCLPRSQATAAACDDDGYSMYVWSRGFDPSAPDCGVYPAGGSSAAPTCFQDNWQTVEARAKLWASCFVPGRHVTRIFVGGIKNFIENNGYDANGVCSPAIVDLLTEARQFGVRVYALFADSQAGFSESTMALYPNQFNENCGTDQYGFDGVAVNNEYFTNIKDCGVDHTAAQQDHLDKLQLTANNASPLPLHFSISWNWDCCDCSSTTYTTRDVEWPALSGSTKSVVAHMVDIVDSVDVQVAYIKNSTMTTRSSPPYNYWLAKTDKSGTSKVYTLAYTNPTGLCQTSFSPHIQGSATVTDDCSIGNPRTEAGMFQGFDFVESQLLQVKGGIHYMNGVFSSGITAGWPAHTSNPTPSCGPATTSPSTGPTSGPTTQPTSPPTPQVTYPSITKFICHRNPQSPENICTNGDPVVGSECTVENDPCGNGGKICRWATCDNTSGSAPPTITPGTPAPAASCTQAGAPCPAEGRSGCCSGRCTGGQTKYCE